MRKLLLSAASAMLLAACVATNDQVAPPASNAEADASAPEVVQTTEAPAISAAFPYEKKFVNVNGSNMAYVESGEGPTALFVHGNPTSSYLWRNIIPYVSDTHRAIAVDLIGMGNSDKPDIEYTFQDHYSYLEGFVEELGLEDISIIAHDWGGGLSLMYATRHSDNVVGVAMMEHAGPPMLPFESFAVLGDAGENFAAFNDPVIGPQLLLDQNIMVEGVIPGTIMRELSEEEMNAYRAPFLTRESRKPAYQFTNEIPAAGEPARNVEAMAEINEWITTSPQPKLVLYADPGLIVSPETAEFLKGYYSNVQVEPIGAGIHFIQEDQPVAIGEALSDWLDNTPMEKQATKAGLKSVAKSIMWALQTGDEGKLKELVSSDSFVQHNADIADGQAGLIAHFSDPQNRWSDLKISRVIQDGDHVVVHSVHTAESDNVRFDVFRFADGKAVEHWGNEQVLRGPNPSGRSMIDGPTEISDLKTTEANTKLVGDFFQSILLEGKFDQLGNFVNGDNYIQHNPDIADGMSSLFAFIQALADQGTPVRFETIHKVLGEGNFALVMSQADFGGNPASFFDLYRVEGGKIAEHWDIIQPMVPADARLNSNGKF